MSTLHVLFVVRDVYMKRRIWNLQRNLDEAVYTKSQSTKTVYGSLQYVHCCLLFLLLSDNHISYIRRFSILQYYIRPNAFLFLLLKESMFTFAGPRVVASKCIFTARSLDFFFYLSFLLYPHLRVVGHDTSSSSSSSSQHVHVPLTLFHCIFHS